MFFLSIAAGKYRKFFFLWRIVHYFQHRSMNLPARAGPLWRLRMFQARPAALRQFVPPYNGAARAGCFVFQGLEKLVP